MDSFEAKPFNPRTRAALDEERYGQRPGDETRVFLVIEPGYEADDRILAVFVGNRLAVYRYAVEATLYGGRVEVSELDDNHAGQTPGMYGQIRRYRDPWTEVKYSTIIDLETGDVISDADPVTRVRNDAHPKVCSDRQAMGRPGAYNVIVSTTGPDISLQTVRACHTVIVNKTRAHVLADLAKDRL